MDKADELIKGQWFEAAQIKKIHSNKQLIVKINNQSILLVSIVDKNQNQQVRAFQALCPHQAYPLTLGEKNASNCITCPWHNWNFDFETGCNLEDGEDLNTFPTRIEDGQVFVYLEASPSKDQLERLKQDLKRAFEAVDYEWISRALARIHQASFDLKQVFSWVIDWSWNRLDAGFDHGYAGLADWLHQLNHASNDLEKIICLQECLGHIAEEIELQEVDTTLNGCLNNVYKIKTIFSIDRLEMAIEKRHSIDAYQQVLAAFIQGYTWQDLEPIFVSIALNHYNAFGHSLIYVQKTAQIIQSLNPWLEKTNGVQKITLSLTKHLLQANREDQTSAFRRYHHFLKCWKQRYTAPDFELSGPATLTSGINDAMGWVIENKHKPCLWIYQQLLHQAALNLVFFDTNHMIRNDRAFKHNINWLDFTHAITFAASLRPLAETYPNAWPAGLLQLACFVGRNNLYTEKNQQLNHWFADELNISEETLVSRLLQEQYDHGCGEFIISVHYLKTLKAAQQEMVFTDSKTKALLAAAVHRFVKSPFKRRYSLRTAQQSIRLCQNQKRAFNDSTGLDC